MNTPTSFFLEELNTANFPFKNIIVNNKSLQDALFQEYLATEKVPNFRLYVKNNFTDQEIRGIKETSNGLPTYESGTVPSNLTAGVTFKRDKLQEIYQKFIQLQMKGAIKKDSYTHVLDQTPTIKSLISVKNHILSAENRKEKNLPVLAKKIKRIISGLKEPELRNALLEKISDPYEALWYSSEEDKDRKEREILFKAFFEPKVQPQKEEEKNQELRNPFPSVFSNEFAYRLFDRLHSNNKETKRHSDYSYIYRKMEKDGLLCNHQRPEVFREWLIEGPYETLIEHPFKTLSNCYSKKKEAEYYAVKEIIKKEISV